MQAPNAISDVTKPFINVHTVKFQYAIFNDQLPLFARCFPNIVNLTHQGVVEFIREGVRFPHLRTLEILDRLIQQLKEKRRYCKVIHGKGFRVDFRLYSDSSIN